MRKLGLGRSCNLLVIAQLVVGRVGIKIQTGVSPGDILSFFVLLFHTYYILGTCNQKILLELVVSMYREC